MTPSPFSLLPLLYKAKIILLKIIQFLLYLLSKNIKNVFLKVVSATFLLFCFVCPKENTSGTKKNAFYFTSSFYS